MSKVMLRKIMLGALCAIFAACMALCCVFAMAPASNVAAEGSGEGSASGAEDELIVYEGSTFYDWASMKAYIESLHAGDEETIIVGADMTADELIGIPDGVKITLTSPTNDAADRRTIKRSDTYHEVCIRVGDEASGGELATLILRDIVIEGNGETTQRFDDLSFLWYTDQSYGEMYDGVYLRYHDIKIGSRGGAIYLDASQSAASKFVMYGGYIGKNHSNQSNANCGAVAILRYGTDENSNPAVFIVEDGSVSDNDGHNGYGAGFSVRGKLIINGGQFFNNVAGCDTVMYSNSFAEYEINGGEFAYNEAKVSTSITALYGSMTIRNAVFHHNRASDVDVLFHVAQHGEASKNTVLRIESALIYDNYSTNPSNQYMGLFDGARGGHIIIDDCQVYNNDIGEGQLFLLRPWGGSGQPISLQINGGEYYENTCTNGLFHVRSTPDPGDRDTATSIEATVNGGTFHDNIILGGNGGVIHVEGGALTINGGEFFNNELQSGDGGCAYLSGGTFTMTGGRFEGNTAAGVGGAAYVTGGTFTMTGGEFIGNVAASYPGFYVNGDINLGGDVRLEGNMTSEGVEQNVYLATEDAKVNIVSPIAEAYIGITKLNNSGVVAKGSGYTLQDYDALALYCDGGGDYTFTVNKDLNQIEMGARSAHEHVYSDYRVDATCDEQGYLMRVCPGCHHIATWVEFTNPDDPAYVSPDSPVYEDYGGADGGIMVDGEKTALAVIAPQGHAYTWVNDDTDPHAAYGGYFTCTHGWTDIVTQEEESCGSRLYLKAEGIEEGGYAYTGKAQTPQVWLSLYSLDEDGNEIFYRSITENMFTAEYADNTAAGEARITLRFVTASAVFNRQYTLTVPTGENMGESLGTVSLTDSLSSSGAQPVVTFTINVIPAEVTVEQPAIPQDGREENAWYTDDADYGYFFENLRKTATADSGLMGEIAGRWEWNIGTAEEPEWSETPPRLAAGTNVLQWRFTPTDESITAVTGEFTVDGVEEYLPVRLNANIASVSPVTDTDGWETFKANWTFSVTYNKGNTVTLGDKSAVTAVLVGDDGTEYADLVVGTYHVKFSYTERGETVTVTPAVSVTVIADELTGLEVVLDGAPVYDTAALEDLRAHLTVTGTHTVGEDTEVTGYTLTCVSAGGWKNEPGEYTVRVTYGQLSQEVQVTVLANRAERLEVTFGQEKPVYTSTEKSDIADYGTLAVTVFYSDGSEKALSYDASGMSGYTIEEGTFADGDTVAIYYKETDKAGSVASVSAEVRVVVDNVRPSHISYEVKEGEHIFTTDTTPTAIQDKLTVTLHYNDGTSESVEHFTVESVSLSSGGELTFVVAAEKDGETFRTEGTVTPEEVAPESLEVALQAGAGTIYVTEDAESIKAWTFTPTDTDNYNTVTGSSQISVTAVEETGISVTKQPDKTGYTALETFVSDGMEVTLHYNDGTSKTVSNYTLSIAGQDDMVLRYGADGNVTVTVTYNGHTAEVQVTVKKIVVEVPSAVSGLVYNGAAQVGVAENDAYTVTGGSATDAGNYKATVMLKDSENYAWSEEFDGTISWSIAKADLTLGVTLEGWTYGESANTPVLSGNSASGEVTYLYKGDGYSSETAPTDAGKYTLTVTVAETQNYKDGTAECSFTVEKATAEVPEIADKIYTGGHLDSGLAETDLYTVEEDNGGIEQGEYTVTLKLKDAANYKWALGDEDGDGVLTLTYKIAKTQNEWTEEVSIEGWTYGESANAPAFGAMFGGDTAVVEYKPAGAEDSAYTAEVPVNAGSYVVRVTIAETDEYAVLTGTAEFTIAKAKYDMSGVTFEDKTVSYSGEAQTIEISGTLPAGVTVTYTYTKDGETVNSAAEAGEYTVTAVFAGDADNYEAIASMTATLTVEASGTGITGGEIAGLAVGGAVCVGLGAAWIVLLRKKRRIGR